MPTGKELIFDLAVKSVVVAASDLGSNLNVELRGSDAHEIIEDHVRQLTRFCDALQSARVHDAAEAEMLELALRDVASKLIDKIDAQSTDENQDSMGKLKAAVHRVMYDQLTHRPVEQPSRRSELNKESLGLFKNHPKFREDLKQS